MQQLLVIGVASLDVLHVAGRIEHSAGGAAMYTALAAWRAGARASDAGVGETRGVSPTELSSVRATLLAPRPHPLPATFAPVAERVTWLGPSVAPEALTRLEIAHHGGGKATLLKAEWGAEQRLTTDDLPNDLSGFEFVHIAALSSAQRQLEFLRACRERGARRVSAGTYARLVYGETDHVRTLFHEADLFFMNENEANRLFGLAARARTEAGKLLFVTLAERGAVVIEGGCVTHVPAPQSGEREPPRGSPAQATLVPAPTAREVDPTGAGDVFCGATLAMLAQGQAAVTAAQRGVALASSAIEHLGPAGLLSTD
ncbi:MAG: carbohydrate kinase family protein [Anaerolineales bacterium]